MPSVSLADIPKARRPQGIPREPCPTCGNRPCTCLMDTLCGQLAQRGQPLPIREYRFAAPARQWRFDGAYVAAKIGIECDGGTWVQGRHTRGYGFENDCEKLDLAAVMGWLILRFTTDMIADGRALTYVERALRVRGMPTEEPGPIQAAFGYPPR
jgi:very-short-patch-repair endonuclease